MYYLQSLSSLLTSTFALKCTLLGLTCRTFHNLTPIFIPSLTCALVPRVPQVLVKSTPTGPASNSSLHAICLPWNLRFSSVLSRRVIDLSFKMLVTFCSVYISYLCLYLSFPCLLPSQSSMKIQELSWDTKKYRQHHFTLIKRQRFQFCAITIKYFKYMLCLPHPFSIVSGLLKKVTSPSSFDIWWKWSQGLAKRQSQCSLSGEQEFLKVLGKHKVLTKMELSLTTHLYCGL